MIVETLISRYHTQLLGWLHSVDIPVVTQISQLQQHNTSQHITVQCSLDTYQGTPLHLPLHYTYPYITLTLYH